MPVHMRSQLPSYHAATAMRQLPTYPAAISFKVGVDQGQSVLILLEPAGACQRSALAGWWCLQS